MPAERKGAAEITQKERAAGDQTLGLARTRSGLAMSSDLAASTPSTRKKALQRGGDRQGSLPPDFVGSNDSNGMRKRRPGGEGEGDEESSEDELNLSPWSPTPRTPRRIVEVFVKSAARHAGRTEAPIDNGLKRGLRNDLESNGSPLHPSPTKSQRICNAQRRRKVDEDKSDGPSSPMKATPPVTHKKPQLTRRSQKQLKGPDSLPPPPPMGNTFSTSYITRERMSKKRVGEDDDSSVSMSPMKRRKTLPRSAKHDTSPRKRGLQIRDELDTTSPPSSPTKKRELTSTTKDDALPFRGLPERGPDSDSDGCFSPSLHTGTSAARRPSDDVPALTASAPGSREFWPSEPRSDAPLPADDTVKLPTSPSKLTFQHHSSSHLTYTIPTSLYPCLNAQKRAILHALQHPHDIPGGGENEDSVDDENSTNDVALQQLTSLINGTVTRGEGNSCILLGPRGSGKTRLIERCITTLPEKPLILRLSGWAQYSDRLAMREIAYQLSQQTGTSFLSQTDDAFPYSNAEDEDERNPFLDTPRNPALKSSGLFLPPSHLPALISILPTLSRSTIVILDAFDLFALHPRQSLLYCLLDTAQSCRAGAGSKGIAVIGVTSRLDTINTLEKRVKSRFSGRIVRTAAPRRLKYWIKLAQAILLSRITEDGAGEAGAINQWTSLWKASVGEFLADKVVLQGLEETFSITQDVRMLSRILTSLTLLLSPASPFFSPRAFSSVAILQRARPRFPFLHTLSYPTICLLIACVHAETAGHPIFTFEMLHEYFRDQVRASTSAPVQVKGGSIGMVRCGREVLMSAFENLVSMKIFVCVTASSDMAKEFVKYRSAVDRDEVKKAVDKIGQLNLKKWLTKAQ